jgi:hypothetical protein
VCPHAFWFGAGRTELRPRRARSPKTIASFRKACRKIPQGAAARDFGCGQGGEAEHPAEFSDRLFSRFATSGFYIFWTLFRKIGAKKVKSVDDINDYPSKDRLFGNLTRWVP